MVVAIFQVGGGVREDEKMELGWGRLGWLVCSAARGGDLLNGVPRPGWGRCGQLSAAGRVVCDVWGYLVSLQQECPLRLMPNNIYRVNGWQFVVLPKLEQL